ncbi:MAG TPA: copper chaperone PCu(A)C [Sphingomicrobium sp.]|nr:copper chaperone PCu(A)C [Sphingomicrobium sp.]
MKTSAAIAALLLASCNAPDRPPAITVESAWARATMPGQSATAVYFRINNRGAEDRLVGVSSTAGQASIHSSAMDGGVMRMRAVQKIEVPAASTVTFAPGGMHVMLTGLAAPLAPGARLPLTLTFERSGPKQVSAAVRPPDVNGSAM